MSLYCTLGFSPFLSYNFQKQVRDGPVAQLVRAPPCHGGGRRFESVPGRQPLGFYYGWIPEWPKGADCKSVVTDFGGSNPPPSIKTVVLNLHLGSQLSWESICLTSRGSQVRALQAPFISSRDRAVWQLVGLITRRSLVQIHLPQSDLEFSSKFFYAIIALFSLEGMLYNAI